MKGAIVEGAGIFLRAPRFVDRPRFIILCFYWNNGLSGFRIDDREGKCFTPRLRSSVVFSNNSFDDSEPTIEEQS